MGDQSGRIIFIRARVDHVFGGGGGGYAFLSREDENPRRVN